MPTWRHSTDTFFRFFTKWGHWRLLSCSKKLRSQKFDFRTSSGSKVRKTSFWKNSVQKHKNRPGFENSLISSERLPILGDQPYDHTRSTFDTKLSHCVPLLIFLREKNGSRFRQFVPKLSRRYDNYCIWSITWSFGWFENSFSGTKFQIPSVSCYK